MSKSHFHSSVVTFALVILFCEGVIAAQAPTLITSTIDESRLVAVGHSTHPMARAEFDRGAASDSLPMERMLLVLKRSAERQAALDKFLEEVQQPGSPNFHRWLTPEQFGQQFGASDSDIQTVTAWLQKHGFQVAPTAPGRSFLEFSGQAGQVRNAFHTEIHKFTVKGVDHWANASDQQIPLALADAVAGVSTLHDFHAAPQSTILNANVSPMPDYTTGSGNHYLSPKDYQTIYNVNSLYPAITGAGTTIAVVGRTNIKIQDIISFRSLFGLPVNTPNIILNGTDPGDLGGGEEAEAVLDTSWSGALATGATVDLVVSKSTNTTDGVDLSEAYIINNNLANVMTESFGSCEASFTAAQEALISSNAQQAAAQGITYTVSAGDAGSAGCDDFNTETSATGPVSVNGLGSSPYTITVGGTQFNENGSNAYWSTSNGSYYNSAVSYIPEDVWNANCTGSTCGTGSILAGGGGASIYFAKPSWQTGVAGIPADGVRDVPDVSLTAAGHDAYLLCLAGGCSTSPATLNGIYGTSASAPSFASIVALISQKAGARLGQLTPRLYALAASENLGSCNASNTSVLPVSGCIFNDVTVGTNAVPGEANYNTAAETYPAGVGYDLASGLGSVNVANLVNNWSGVVVTAPTASLSPGSLTFASQTTGTTSAGQPVTLSNAGSATLNIASIALSGANAHDFGVSNNCGTTLAAGGTCSITVTFTPSATGARTANLVVTDNSGNVNGATQSLAITGTGTAAASGASATYKGADSGTLGNWTGKYGADGQLIPNGLQNPAAYATVNFSGSSNFTWTTSTIDPRALQSASGSSSRIASVYYSASAFTIDVNLTDGNTHQVSLYLCDWNSYLRTETVTIIDASNSNVLSTQSFSSFTGGVWESYLIKGHVQIQVTHTGGDNAIVNGIFFDPVSSTTVTSSASYSGADSVTLGNWTGKYGADGQLIPNGLQNPAAYATVNLTGSSNFTWTTSTSDPRALQSASGSSSRIASVYYSASAFTIDVNLTDGNTHKVSLYLCDWNSYLRTETVTIIDASSSNVLSTQSFASFTGGVWESYLIKGHVQIQVTHTGGDNAIVNGIFFDPVSSTTVTSSASYSGADSATLGNWTGKYGADGQLIPNGLQNPAAYAAVNFSGSSNFTWTTSTSDPRALQSASGSSSRIASVYYSASAFTIDVNLTDGNTHQVSLYLCDWNSYLRTETVTIIDASSSNVLSTQSFASFTGGVWEIYLIKGHVQIQVTHTGGDNAIVNGIFFDPVSSTAVTSSL
jgi:hypothetical protein